jgi:hypothetical protein
MHSSFPAADLRRAAGSVDATNGSDVGIFYPEISVSNLAPIFHLAGVKKLNGEVKRAHLAIPPDVPGLRSAILWDCL